MIASGEQHMNMRQLTGSVDRKTFYVSYALYDDSDLHRYPDIRQFCKSRLGAKYLRDACFICCTSLSASRIARELYDKIFLETGQRGQVVVIDSIESGYGACLAD